MNFADRKHDRQFEFATDSQEFEGSPVFRAGDFEEFFDTLLSDVDGARGPVQVILDKQQVISQIVFGGGIRFPL